jgi:hypothetical protein
MKFRGLWFCIALACAGQALAVDGAADTVVAAADTAWRPAANGQRDDAAAYALAAAMVVNEVATRCATVDAERAQAAHAARDQWWARNQLTVEAANGYVRYLQALHQVRRGEEAAKAFYGGVFDEMRAQGATTSVALFAKDGNEGATCDRVLADYLAGRMDLATDTDKFALLEAIDQDLRTYRGKQ